MPGMPCLCDRTASVPQSGAATCVTNGRLESGSLRVGAVVNLVLSILSAVCANSVHVLYFLPNYL